MSLALYRKYRPQTFKEITDQNHIKIILEREVASGKVAHAYVFSGPRGTGKTSMARILAKAINCEKREQGEGEPCNKCPACDEITAGRALDVLEIDAASHTGVDNVRETIVETVKFAPTRLKYKVFIIDESHMLSNSAWNALLKVMEEPPAHIIFILATTEAHKIPLTILSRCQRFGFHRVRVKNLVERLQFIARQEKVRVSDGVLENIAHLSEGCVRDSEGLLEQLISLGEKEVNEETASLVLPRTSLPMVLDLVSGLVGGNVKNGLSIIREAVEQGIDLNQFSSDILEAIRKMLLIKVAGAETAEGGMDTVNFERLCQMTNAINVQKIICLIEGFVRAKSLMKIVHIPQLPLEVAVVEGCGCAENTRVLPAAPIAPPAPKTRTTVPMRESPPAIIGAQSVDISLDEIITKWPEVLKQAQKENHSLSFLLYASAPVSIEQGIIQIAVQFPLYCDKLNEPKTRAVLEKVIGEIYAKPLRTRAIVAEQATVKNNVVDDVLGALGGRVIE